MFHADAVFRTGTSHEREGTPCQDYAVSGNSPYPFGIISDGCSSSPNTDTGSRILSLSAASVIGKAGFSELSLQEALDELRNGVISTASGVMKALGLDASSMDATLGAVHETPDGIRAFLFGDGCIAARFRDTTEITTVSWAGNMPGYPMYLHEPERLNVFIRGSEELAGSGAAVTVTKQAGEHEISISGFSADEGLRGYAVEWQGERIPDVAGIFTDGVLSMMNGDGTIGADIHEVIDELTSVKSVSMGGFAVRRINKALQLWARRGSRPYDDISMALLASENAA